MEIMLERKGPGSLLDRLIACVWDLLNICSSVEIPLLAEIGTDRKRACYFRPAGAHESRSRFRIPVHVQSPIVVQVIFDREMIHFR